MPKVIQLPDHVLCEHCGYALKAEGHYQHGTMSQPMYCTTSRCKGFEKRLLIPFKFLNVRSAPTSPAQAESDHGRPQENMDA